MQVPWISCFWSLESHPPLILAEATVFLFSTAENSMRQWKPAIGVRMTLSGGWWLALKPCGKSSFSWAGYCCTYRTMRLSRARSKYMMKMSPEGTLSPDFLLHLSSPYQLKLITSWDFPHNQLMEKEKNPGLDKEWVSLVCWWKLHHCHIWWQP